MGQKLHLIRETKPEITDKTAKLTPYFCKHCRADIWVIHLNKDPINPIIES